MKLNLLKLTLIQVNHQRYLHPVLLILKKNENKSINIDSIDSTFYYDVGRYFDKNNKLNDFTKFQ